MFAYVLPKDRLGDDPHGEVRELSAHVSCGTDLPAVQHLLSHTHHIVAVLLNALLVEGWHHQAAVLPVLFAIEPEQASTQILQCSVRIGGIAHSEDRLTD